MCALEKLVTVYIPTRNRAKMLDRALESVWAQGNADIEVIVVDDASEDETQQVLARHQDRGDLRILRNGDALGAQVSRNIAVEASRGRYVTGLDDDDEMLPGRLHRMVRALRPEDAFVCASDVMVRPQSLGLRLTRKRIDLQCILSRNVVGNQILAERAKLLACGLFDISLPAAQDYDLWIRMIQRFGKARGLRRPLQRVHAHGGSRISASTRRRHGYWAVYKKHRAIMPRSSRACHLYNLRRASGKLTLLPRDLRFFVPQNRARLLWHAVQDLLASQKARPKAGTGT